MCVYSCLQFLIGLFKRLLKLIKHTQMLINALLSANSGKTLEYDSNSFTF